MDKKEITEVVNRYLTSKNEDWKKDYEAVKLFMAKIESDSSSYSNFSKLEFHELLNKIAIHYLNLLRANRELPTNHTPTANDKLWRKGYALLLQYEKATTVDDRLHYEEEFETILFNSNLDTKVILWDMKQHSDRRVKSLQQLDGSCSSDSEKKFIDLNEIEYIKTALQRLRECKTVEELSEEYWKLSPQVAESINNDLNFESRRDKEIAYGSYSSRYKEMLVALEKMEDKLYNVQSPKYCLNNELPKLLQTTISNHNNNGCVAPSAVEAVEEFGYDLQYRYDVVRTTPRDFDKMVKDFKIIYNLVVDEAPITTVNAAIAKLKW